MDIFQLLIALSFLGVESRQAPASWQNSSTRLNPQILRSTPWVLVNNPKINVQFMDAERIAGSGGCNRFVGNYRLVGNRLKLGPIVSTKMACTEGKIMAEETKFFQALETAQVVGWDGQVLSVSTQRGILQFRRANWGANPEGK